MLWKKDELYIKYNSEYYEKLIVKNNYKKRRDLLWV